MLTANPSLKVRLTGVHCTSGITVDAVIPKFLPHLIMARYNYPDWLKTAVQQKYPRMHVLGARPKDIDKFISQITIKAAPTTVKDLKVEERSRAIVDINTKEHENHGDTIDEVEITTMKKRNKQKDKNYTITMDKRLAINGGGSFNIGANFFNVASVGGGL